MKKFLTRTVAGLLMLLVAGLTAFGTLRLFIHGREVSVPSLSGMSDADAAAAARRLGLNLSVENRFYSAAITPNHVLSQSPVAGSHVRRGWQIRVTESLGGQHVDVPEVIGQMERPASLVLRRLQLELEPVAHLPAPAPAGIVLAQNPPPNANGLNGPHVSLLISDDEAAGSSVAYVMPALGGLTLNAANARLATVGLHIGNAVDPSALPASPADPNAPASDPAIPPTVVAPPPVSGNAVIAGQTPAPGHKVTRGDVIRVTVAHAVNVTPESLLPIP